MSEKEKAQQKQREENRIRVLRLLSKVPEELEGAPVPDGVLQAFGDMIRALLEADDG